MGGYWIAPDDYAPDPQVFSGSAHSVSGEKEEEDKAELVRKVAEEVSGKKMPRPPTKRIGF